jgi:hypothetical protein
MKCPKPFNIKGFLYYLKRRENKYSLKDLDAKGNAIPNVIVDMGAELKKLL